MKELKDLNLNLKIDDYNYIDFENCISDLLQSNIVCSMEQFKHHCSISCLEHSIHVSYISYKICKFLKLDCNSAARGGLLHDMFLYDWRITKLNRGKHAFVHPYIAFENANVIFCLNKKEKDIIKKHMWPLTIILPKYKESFIVSLVDKYCAFIEIINSLIMN